jgi:hypothetical protein
MLVDVVNVFPIDEYKLDLLYANGEQRRFDTRPLLSIKPWDKIANPNVFRLVRADYGTVVWRRD